MLEGAFTLELKGMPPRVVKAGEAMVEPPNSEMTGYNRSTTEMTKVAIFYVSKADAPFLNPLHWPRLGPGPTDLNQKMTVAAMQMADMKVWAQLS